MLHKSTAGNHTSAVPEPELVADVKKAEMKRTILQRFCYRAEAVTPDAKPRKHSPYWQPVDEEC
jgi:hypothetical protein